MLDESKVSTPTGSSPAYSGQIRGLKLQVSDLQQQLDAAMVVNKQLQEEKSATTTPPVTPTDPVVCELQDQIHQLTTALQTAQASRLSDIDHLTNTHDNLTIDLRSEIATLHAERHREKEHSQSIQEVKYQEISALRLAVSETRAKAQADLTAAHNAHQRIAHTDCLPATTSSSLQAEITEHLLTIADLKSELQDAKYTMEDITTTAAHVECNLGNMEKSTFPPDPNYPTSK